MAPPDPAGEPEPERDPEGDLEPDLDLEGLREADLDLEPDLDLDLEPDLDLELALEAGEPERLRLPLRDLFSDSSSDSRDTPEQYARTYGGNPALITTEGPGMVPLENLIGRAEVMMFSFNRCDPDEGLRCPGRRWFRGL